MGVRDVGRLSLGEYTAICRSWARAHDEGKAEAPTGAELDAAMMAARGLG